MFISCDFFEVSLSFALGIIIIIGGPVVGPSEADVSVPCWWPYSLVIVAAGPNGTNPDLARTVKIKIYSKLNLSNSPAPVFVPLIVANELWGMWRRRRRQQKKRRWDSRELPLLLFLVMWGKFFQLGLCPLKCFPFPFVPKLLPFNSNTDLEDKIG
jgi:hypothetical protein